MFYYVVLYCLVLLLYCLGSGGRKEESGDGGDGKKAKVPIGEGIIEEFYIFDVPSVPSVPNTPSQPPKDFSASAEGETQPKKRATEGSADGLQ
jgi:hypothetical protein